MKSLKNQVNIWLKIKMGRR